MANIINPQSDSERLAKVEGILEQMDKRLFSIENRMEGIERRLDSLEKGQRWLAGMVVMVLLANIGTLITVILTLSRQP